MFKFFSIFTTLYVSIVKMFNGNPWFSVGVLQKACPHIFNHGHSCKQEVRRNVIMYSTFNFNDSLLIIRSPPLPQENAQMTIQTICKIYLSQLTQVRVTAWKIYRVIEPCFRVFKCKSMLKVLSGEESLQYFYHPPREAILTTKRILDVPYLSAIFSWWSCISFGWVLWASLARRKQNSSWKPTGKLTS